MYHRFRSITKQYFRKADGVLIMYDVTSEASFKNVLNWMASVQVISVSHCLWIEFIRENNIYFSPNKLTFHCI